MSGNQKRAGKAAQFEVQRIRVNAQGYDRGGCYWGAGPDVFILTSPDGAHEITVRAKDVKEARSKADAELARAPGAPPPGDKIGGATPHKSRHEIIWRDPVSGASIKLKITHSRDYLRTGHDHIEIESLEPRKARLPITETGYRSHFLSAEEIAQAGGAVAAVSGWLKSAAASKEWQCTQAKAAQGELFAWADATREVSAKAGRKQNRPTAKPRKTRTKDRAPE